VLHIEKGSFKYFAQGPPNLRPSLSPSSLLRIAATSIPVYVTGWYGLGFKSHSLPFLLTYPEADLTYYFEQALAIYKWAILNTIQKVKLDKKISRLCEINNSSTRSPSENCKSLGKMHQTFIFLICKKHK